MSYLIKTIKEENLADFLLNPFDKTGYFEDYVLQKYPMDHIVDELIGINKETCSLINIGYINYKIGKVFLKSNRALKNANLETDCFVNILFFRRSLMDLLAEKIEIAKIDRLSEIESSDEYAKVYSYYKKNVFQDIVFSLLGAADYYENEPSHTAYDISDFCQSLKIDQLMDIVGGKLDVLDEFIEDIIFTNRFIRTDIVFSKIVEEANDYFKAGIFTEREKALINYLEKTKASGAKRFSAYLISGRKIKCKNEVSCNGKIYEVGDSFYSVGFEQIERVEYKGKIIYKNENIKKIKAKITKVHTKNSP